MYECSDSGKLELILTTNTKKTYCDPNYCVFKPNHPCFMFLVLCLFYLSSSICVCHLSHGPFVGVPSSQVLPSYCTSTCARSCCTWRANCVDSNPKKNCYPRIFQSRKSGASAGLGSPKGPVASRYPLVLNTYHQQHRKTTLIYITFSLT